MKTNHSILVLILVCFLGATSGYAKRLSPFRVFYNTDYLSSGVGGLFNYGYGTITLSNLTGTVSKAFLYWHGPMVDAGTNGPGNSVVNVNGQTVAGTDIGLSGDNCWSSPYNYFLSRAYRADVTSLVESTRNGYYYLTNFIRAIGTNANAINVNGASLIVFYDDGNPWNNNDVVLLDGNDGSAFGAVPPDSPLYDGPGWSVSLNNFRYQGGPATIEFHVSDGQYYEPRDDGPLQFGVTSANFILAPQGHIFSGDRSYMPAANNGPSENGCLWDIRSWAIDPYMTNGQTALVVSNRFVLADCTSLVAAAVMLPPGSVDHPVIGSYGLRSTRTFELTFTGMSAVAYSVLASTNFTTWQPLGIASELSNGVYRFIDTDTPAPNQRFYQIRRP